MSIIKELFLPIFVGIALFIAVFFMFYVIIEIGLFPVFLGIVLVSCTSGIFWFIGKITICLWEESK